MPRDDGYHDAVVMVEIERIDPRPAIDMREITNAEILERYTEEYDKLPPIRVVADTDDRHWTADGSYRLRVAMQLGKKVVPCFVRRGTYLDAFRDASRANDTHGLPLTQGDKKKRVLTALSHPLMGGAGWSQGKIADHCGVSQQYVASLDERQPCGSHNNCDPRTTISGKDGRSYSTRQQYAAKIAAVVAELRRDPTQSNYALAGRFGVDRNSVSKARREHGLPPSTNPGGPHRPRAKVADATDRQEPEPLAPADAPAIAPPLAVAAADEEEEVDLEDLLNAEREILTDRFNAFPEDARPQYVMMLRSHIIRLAALCPTLVERSRQLLA